MDDAAGTDRTLWERAAAGDAAAFAAVYDRYAQRLLTYAHRRTGSVPRAEDAVSLVMLEAWRRRRDVRFGPDGTVAGWLFRTARYVLANEARARRRHGRALERIAGLAPAAPEDVDRRLIDDERLRHALAALAGLAPRDREVLELAAWSGLGESEMAAALGIPVGTVKSRLSRARRRLAARCAAGPGPLAVSPLAATTEDLP
ncbi:MAG TPA: sigma-70 family RNA polymerase sigma factor [Acidimicrobiales bacterium]|nr:sigma-70 family RNA polymerase sigma factor [Acidimicrobiales bacterium]